MNPALSSVGHNERVAFLIIFFWVFSFVFIMVTWINFTSKCQILIYV